MALSVPARADEAYFAVDVGALTFAGPPPMGMPTAVALAPDGSLYVADGVNDRILHLASNGDPIAAIDRDGVTQLSRPMSVRVDAAGRLWIADTGNQRIIARATDGTWGRPVDLRPYSGGAGIAEVVAPDVTDLALTPDGRALWFVDNDNHRLGRLDVETGGVSFFGTPGEELGQFQYPFMLAVGDDGDLFVSDVINGRIQVLSGEGQPLRTLGTFGVAMGQLHKPSGIALDADGRVWVADSTTGTIQVFEPSGRVIDALRHPSGRVMHFDLPVGLALDRGDNLYVVESGVSRVRKLHVTRGDAVAPFRTPPGDVPGAHPQPRACTVCHVDWLQPLASGRPTDLMDVPVSTPSRPPVSQWASCLTCHNGAVVDSRRGLSHNQGHHRGAVPPPGMEVPDALPLVDGRVDCRTCHSAHTHAGPGQTFRNAISLRGSDDPVELCVQCHTEPYGDIERGHHPVQNVPSPTPLARVEAGRPPGPDATPITCMTCHLAHGSHDESMLVGGAGANTLCLTCHAVAHWASSPKGDYAGHPLDVQLDDDQRRAVEWLNTRFAPDGGLLCISCHRTHDALGGSNLLADTITDASLCLRCHAEQRGVLQSPHDLRLSAREEKNARRQTAAESGPCGACHAAHQPARPPAQDVVDTTGVCVTCHQAGRCAERVTQPFLHPTEVSAALLAALDAASGERHEGTTPPGGSGRHEGNGTEPSHDREGVLEERHEGTEAWRHEGASDEATKRRSDEGERHEGMTFASLQCVHCHEPHADSTMPVAFLRLARGAAVESLCINCHVDAAPLASSMHNAEALADFSPLLLGEGLGVRASLGGQPAGRTACGPCHAVHQPAGRPDLDNTWAGPRDDDPQSAAFQYCTGCHVPGGFIGPVRRRIHPAVVMSNVVPQNAPGFMPLVNAAGHADNAGRIGCITCHLPHGRPAGGGFGGNSEFGIRNSAAQGAPRFIPHSAFRIPHSPGTDVTRALRAAAKPMLRPYVAPNLCSGCHGPDGLRRFLYYHKGASLQPAVHSAYDP